MIKIPFVDLQRPSAEAIIAVTGSDAEFAKALVSHGPYEHPEDILKVTTLHRVEWMPHVANLLVAGRTRVRRDSLHEREPGQSGEGDGFRYGVRQIGKDHYRVSVRHAVGLELIAADIVLSAIDWRTIRIGGYLVGELGHLDRSSRSIIFGLLHSQAGYSAGRLWRSDLEITEESSARAVTLASEVLYTFQAFTFANFGTGWGEPPPGSPMLHWDTNGCTLMPNRDWRDCCDAHDLCYSQHILGDRAPCDLELARCIAAHGGPEHWIVGLTFGLGTFLLGGLMDKLGVVSGGDPKDSVPAGPVGPAPPGLIGGGRCTYRIHVLKVRYRGEDVATDWKIRFSSGPHDPLKYQPPEFTMPPGGEHVFNPQANIVYASDPRSLYRCGDQVPGHELYIEVDALDRGKMFFLQPFTCRPAPNPVFTVTLPLDTGLPFFKKWAYLDFDLQLDTKCV